MVLISLRGYLVSVISSELRHTWDVVQLSLSLDSVYYTT